MTMHESAVSRLLSDRGPECIVPDECVTGVCDDLGIRVTRAVVNGKRVPEKDGRWVGRLRRLVAAKLRNWGLEGDFVHEAQLMVSELMSNALRYGDQEADIGFRFILTPRTITIAVNGGIPYGPRVIQTDADSEGGRGLFLVATLASAWGIGDDGTTTWCTLIRPVPEVRGC